MGGKATPMSDVGLSSGVEVIVQFVTQQQLFNCIQSNDENLSQHNLTAI